MNTSKKWLALVLVVVAFSTGCGGSVDSRLVGVWETRKGFDRTTRLQLQSSGGVRVVVESNGKKGKPISGSWHVSQAGGKELTIVIKLSGKGSRKRRVKFLNDDLIEMSATDGSDLSRYARQ